MAGKKLRVLYSINGDGLGHAFAALSILAHLSLQCDVLVVGWGEALKMVKSRGYATQSTFPEYRTHKNGEEVDLHETLNVVKMVRKVFKALKREKRVFDSFRPDVVVADGRIATPILAGVYGVPLVNIGNQFSNYEKFFNGAKKAALTLSAKLLFKAGELSKATILVRDFPPPRDVSEGLVDSRKLKNVSYVGPCIVWPKARRAKKKAGEKKLVLCSISGTGLGKSLLEKIYAASKDLKGCEFVVFSKAHGIKLRNSANFRFVKKFNDAELYDYYSRADAYVGLPGHNAVMQCLCFGVPMVLAYPRNHLEQMHNAESVHRKNVGVSLGSNPTESDVAEEVKRVSIETSFKRNAMEYFRLYGKFNGARKAAQVIMEKARKGKARKTLADVLGSISR